MIKSKIRKKILYIREKKNNKNIKLPLLKVFKEIKKKISKNKIIGGYYPVNFEIDILEILEILKKKNRCSNKFACYPYELVAVTPMASVPTPLH